MSGLAYGSMTISKVEDGVGVESVTNYYLATSAFSGVTRDTSGWTTKIQTMDATNQYLWSYEIVHGTDGSVINRTTPVIIGRYGQDGSVGATGPQGPAGEQGEPGNGISSVVSYYKTTNSATAPTSGWTTTSSNPTASLPYLWFYQSVNYTNGNHVDTNPAIIAMYERTITKVETWYYLSTTNTGQTGGSWGKTVPAYVSGRYYWTKVRYYYTDNTGANNLYFESDPVLDNGINTAIVQSAEATQTAIDANNIAQAVNQHFWYDTNGAHVSVQTKTDYDSSPSGANSLSNAYGIQLRDGSTTLAQFAPSGVSIGDTAKNHSTYNANGAYWYRPNEQTAFMKIEDGVLTDVDGYNYWDMPNGTVRWGNANNYVSFDGDNLSIQAQSMSFKPTGSQTYKDVETAINDATTEAMDNLQIGGRNLLYDTNAPTFNPTDGLGNRYWSDIGTFLNNAEGTYWGEISDSPVPGVKYGAICVCTATGGKHHLVAFYSQYDRVRVITGETYTMSFWAKTDTAGAKVAFGISSNSNWEKITDSPTGDHIFSISAVNTWEKFTLTFKYTGTATNTYGDEVVPNNIFYMGSEYNVVGTVWLCGFKLELGNQDTDWVDYDWKRTQNSGRNLFYNTNTIDLTSNATKPNINGYYNDGLTHYGNVEYQVASLCTTIPSTHGLMTTCITNTTNPMFRFGTSTTDGRYIPRAKGLYGLQPGGTYTLSADVSAKLYSGFTAQSEAMLIARLYIDNDGNDPQLAVTPDNYYLVMPDGSRAMFAQDTTWRVYMVKPWLKWQPGEYGEMKTGHCTFTFTLPKNANRFYLIVRANGTNSGYHLEGDYLDLQNIKLEEGDYGTSWTPAPEDIDKDMSYIQNVAEITNTISTSNAFYVDGGWIYNYLAYTDVDCEINDQTFVNAIEDSFMDGQYIFMCGQTWMLLRDGLDTISPNLLMESYIRCYTSIASGESLDVSKYSTEGIVTYTRNATTNKGFLISNYSAMKPNTTYTIRFLLQKKSGSASNITTFYIHASDPSNINDSVLYVDGVQYGSAINTSYSINFGSDSHEIVVNFTTNSSIATGTYPGMILQLNKSVSNSYSVTLSQLKLERNTYATDWSAPPTILNPNANLADYGITLKATPTALDNIIIAAWKTENLRGETYELKQQLAQLVQRASQMQNDFYNVSINTAYQVESGFQQANAAISGLNTGINQTAQGLETLSGVVSQLGVGMDNIQGAMPQLQSICKDVFADADGLHVFGFDPEVDTTTNKAIYLTAAEVNIKPDRISFRRGMASNAVAWVGDKNDGSGNYKLYIQEAEVRENVRIGDLGFVPRSNGNMCLKFIGGDDALGWIVNKSTFAGSTNPGECYFHGYDAEGNAKDINGYVYWDNKRVIIPKGYAGVNPNKIAPYNTTIYVIYRISNSTFYNAWLEGSTWYGMSYAASGAPSAKATFTWADSTDIVIGYYVEPSDEGAITECVLYSPVKSYSQITAGTANPNLLRGTHNISSIGTSSAWSSGTWRSAGAGASSGTRTIVTTSGQNIVPKGVQFDVTNTSNDNYGNALMIGQNSVPVEKGKTYTISCYAKGKGRLFMGYGISVFGPIDNSGKINIDTNTYRRFSATFTAQTDNTAYVNDNGTNIFFGASGAGTSLTICTMKLEEGTVATDWCPSEYD